MEVFLGPRVPGRSFRAAVAETNEVHCCRSTRALTDGLPFFANHLRFRVIPFAGKDFLALSKRKRGPGLVPFSWPWDYDGVFIAIALLRDGVFVLSSGWLWNRSQDLGPGTKRRDGTKLRGGSMVPASWNLTPILQIFLQIRVYPSLPPLSVRRPAVFDRLLGDIHSRDLVPVIGNLDLGKYWGKKADLADLKRFRQKQTGVLPDPEQNRGEQGLVKADRVDLFQIFIKTIAGSHVCMQIWDRMNVMDLKREIQDKLGVPASLQILFFSGQCMQDQLSLQHYRVAKDSTIVLNHRLRGGSKGASSKSTGSYCDAAKGRASPKGKEPTAAHTPPGQYIVDQAPENPSITLDLPEVKYIFSDLIKNAVICRFNGFWPKTDALYQWIHTTWTKNCQINLCSKGFFIVNFYTEEEKEKTLSEGPWFWGNAGLFITPWFPEFDTNTMVVSRMPVWVRLHNLPIHFWHHNTLSVIGNTLGRMLKVDPARHIKGIFTFARICVEVDLSKGLPESIILTFNNTQWKQPLDYENTAFRCRGCQQTGHLLNACKSQNKNKPQQRKPKGWQNIDEIAKKNAAEKKASSNKEDVETEEEDDDITIENEETGVQKENTSDQKTPQFLSNHAEIHHGQDELTGTVQSIGGNKRQHHSDTSDSDKEIGLQNSETHLVIVLTEPTQGEWRKVEKKKGRKT